MTEKMTEARKKAWQKPSVEAVANVRETRGGFTPGKGEIGPNYAS